MMYEISYKNGGRTEHIEAKNHKEAFIKGAREALGSKRIKELNIREMTKETAEFSVTGNGETKYFSMH